MQCIVIYCMGPIQLWEYIVLTSIALVSFLVVREFVGSSSFRSVRSGVSMLRVNIARIAKARLDLEWIFKKINITQTILS